MSAKSMTGLMEELAKKVGGQDAAEALYKQFKSEGLSNNKVKNAIRNYIDNFDSTSQRPVKEAIKEGLEGQMYMNFDGVKDPSIAKNTPAGQNYYRDDKLIARTFDYDGYAYEEMLIENPLTNFKGYQKFPVGENGHQTIEAFRDYNIKEDEFNHALNAFNKQTGNKPFVDNKIYSNSQIEGQQSFIFDEQGNVSYDGMKTKEKTNTNTESNQSSSSSTTQEQQVNQPDTDELDRANRGWMQRTLDGVKERATGIWNVVSGNNYRQTTADRINYNNQVFESGQGEYITSNREYRQKMNNADSPNDDVKTVTEDVLNNSNSSGIGDWAKDNLGWAAAIVGGTGLLAGGLLFGGDDDEY